MHFFFAFLPLFLLLLLFLLLHFVLSSSPLFFSPSRPVQLCGRKTRLWNLSEAYLDTGAGSSSKISLEVLQELRGSFPFLL